jgi:hypothetical protein
MTLTDIDRELERLAAASASINANLMALEEDPNRQMLEIAPLRGRSAEQWNDAKHAFSDLWELSATFRDFVDRARTLRGHRTVPSPTVERELSELLYSASIALRREDIPLADRDLLGSGRSASRCTPDELVALMRDAFDRTRRVVAAVAIAWDTLVPRVAAMRLALSEARERAGALATESPQPIAGVEQRLRQVAETLLDDPLAVTVQDVELVEAQLDSICVELTRAAELRDGVDAKVSQAHVLMDELRALEADAIAAHETTTAKILEPGIHIPTRWYDGTIAEWEAVQDLVDDERWPAAAAKLDVWTRRTRAEMEEARDFIANARRPLEVRDQLRGRLDAYHAKAARLCLVEVPEVSAAHRPARDALYTAPTDLTRAADLVQDYQDALRQAARVREIDR